MQVQQMQVPHKHSEFIKKWADGYPIQFKSRSDGIWRDTLKPLWDEDTEYRVEPEKTTEVVGFSYDHGVYGNNYLPDIEIEFVIQDGRVVGAKVLGV